MPKGLALFSIGYTGLIVGASALAAINPLLPIAVAIGYKIYKS